MSLRNPLWVIPLAAVVVLLGTSCGAQADYPADTVELVVPWSPGGSTDQAARVIADIVNQEGLLDEPMQVVNREGAAGTVGTNEVIAATPDGYFVGYPASGPVTTQFVFRDLPYDRDDFEPVLNTVTQAVVLSVREDSPHEDIESFMAAMEQEDVSIGHPGEGSNPHIAASKLATEAGLDFTSVPFDGAAPATTALLGGDVDAQVSHPAEVAEQVRAGEVRVLANFGEERLEEEGFEDAKTFEEAGVGTIVQENFHPLIVPNDTPDEVIATLEDVFEQAVEHERFQEFAREQIITVDFQTGDALAERIDQVIADTQQVFEELGLESQ